MKAQNLRWGVLGCARIAERSLIPALREADNAFLAGIAARDPARAEDWARRFGIGRAYPGYAELVEDPGIDAVYIPLANHLHAEWTIRAARAGKHVLCEKPLARTAAEAAEMFDAAEEAGVLLLEAFMYRFHPQIDRTIEILRSGRLGEIRTVRSAFTFKNANPADDYRWDFRLGGGALYDVGCYPVSAARTVFGREPRQVYARMRRHHREAIASGVDLGAALFLDFGFGAQALLDCAFDVEFQSRLEVAGTDGRLTLDRAFSAKLLDAPIAVTRGGTTEVIDIPAANAYTRMVEHFGRAVAGAEPLRFGRDDALGTARVIDAAFASERSGRPESLGGPA
jgi:xylose dehydrogenase (NAD/NADP)